MKNTLGITLAAGALVLLSACSTKINGAVKLVGADLQPVSDDEAKGVVVNMINTSAALGQASYSVLTDEHGLFASESGRLEPGLYKVEVARIGYKTATETVELKKFRSPKIELLLKRIAEGNRKALPGSSSDEDKIINPGEVNIQPPAM